MYAFSRHEFVVCRLPGDVAMDAMRQGQFSEEFQFVGVTSAAAGQTAAALVLVDLAPGTYAGVCFVDEPQEMLHLARGMIAEFTVQSTHNIQRHRVARKLP